jgi:hypothetical protein
VVQALKARHRAEMLALLEALAPCGKDQVVCEQSWYPTVQSEKGEKGRWEVGEFYELRYFVVQELGSGDPWEIPWPPEDTTSANGGQG